jgi:hypothetical protein
MGLLNVYKFTLDYLHLYTMPIELL